VIATNRTASQSIREGVREFFLLEKAEQKITSLEGSQRDIVRNYYDAGNRRLNVAQDLRGPVQTPAALTLYRQGMHFLALAYLASRGHANLDSASSSLEETFRELDRAFEADGLKVPREYNDSRPVLVSPNPLDLDRMSVAEAALRVEELEAASRWLSSLIDARSPIEVKWARFFRIGITAAVMVALLAMLVIRLLTPKNIALGRPVTASSVGFSTAAVGAVDGSKNGAFGFHSALEDSPWLSIDLGRNFAISRIRVFGRGDGGPYDQSIPLALEVSDDGTSYQQIALRSQPFSEYEPWVVQPGALVTRYLRLKTMRSSYLVLGEVEVNGVASK
jgi:hypothetical protein